MLHIELHDQKTILQLLRKMFRQQSGHKTSGDKAVDKYIVPSGKAKHKKPSLLSGGSIMKE